MTIDARPAVTYTFRALWRAESESETRATLQDADDTTANPKKAGTVRANWQRPRAIDFVADAVSFFPAAQKAVRALNDPASELESLVLKVTTECGKLVVGSHHLGLTHEHVTVSGELDGHPVTVRIARDGLPLPTELGP